MPENPYIDELAGALVEEAIMGIDYMTAVEYAYDNSDWNLTDEDIEKALSRATRGEGRAARE